MQVMLDLETLSTEPNAAIVAIGAVIFNPDGHELGSEFYIRVDLESSQQLGADISASTVYWWLSQSEEARCEVLSGEKHPLHYALMEFKNFITPLNKKYVDEETGTVQTVFPKIWGKGSSFDNVILESAYKMCGIETPWDRWSNQDYRTIKDLAVSMGFEETREFAGDRHNALSDAKHQALSIQDFYRFIKSGGDS